MDPYAHRPGCYPGTGDVEPHAAANCGLPDRVQVHTAGCHRQQGGSCDHPAACQRFAVWLAGRLSTDDPAVRGEAARHIVATGEPWPGPAPAGTGHPSRFAAAVEAFISAIASTAEGLAFIARIAEAAQAEARRTGHPDGHAPGRPAATRDDPEAPGQH